MKKSVTAPAASPVAASPSLARVIVGGVILLSAAALVVFIVVQAVLSYGQSQGPRPVSAFTTPTGCAAQPRFVNSMLAKAHDDGMISAEAEVLISTSEPKVMGLVFVVSDLQAKKQFLYRDEGVTWDDAGYLGPFFRDEDGYVYTIPVPRVSLADNPPDGATTIWRLDTDSQLLKPWVTVPATAAPSTRNPFGLLGLTYDCSTSSLYASSVAGSTPREELGQVVRVSKAGEVTPILSNVDALSLAVLQGGGRSWLYVGSARQGVLNAYPLDSTGAVVGEPREMVSLRADGAGADDRIRRIVIEDGELFVFASPFTYALRATGEREEMLYRYSWDAATQTWAFVGKRDRMQ